MTYPHAGVNQNQRSPLIESRSPFQSSLPRSLRISACLLRRNSVCRPSSTASRLLLRPVARSASRISLSSIKYQCATDVYLIVDLAHTVADRSTAITVKSLEHPIRGLSCSTPDLSACA